MNLVSFVPFAASAGRLVAAVCLCGATAAVWPAGAQDIVGSDEIARRLGPEAPWKGIAVVTEPGAGPAPSSVAAPGPDPVAGGERRTTLPAVQFEFDSARFTPAGHAQLRELGIALREPSLVPYTFSVHGHTDSTGTAEYNRALSLRRAQAVTRYLVDSVGIAADRLIEIGLGESRPIPGLDPAHERNRRVEVVNRGWSARDATADTPRAPLRRALLIGIDDYPHFNSLNGPANDARVMAAFLRDHAEFQDEDIRLLLDSDATRDAILTTAEEWLVRGTTSGDEVFLYFSGHGFQQPDEPGGDEYDALDETIVPANAWRDGADGPVRGMITDDEIAALLDRLSGRSVWVVVDACHSGTVTKGIKVVDDNAGSDDTFRFVKTLYTPDGKLVRLPTPELDDATQARLMEIRASTSERALSRSKALLWSDNPDIVIWTAVDAEQVALVDREATHGAGSVFTRRLLRGARDGLADADGDGVTTMAELYRYVTAESKDYCLKYPGDCDPQKGLTPQLEAKPSRLQQAFMGAGDGLSQTAAFAKDLIVRGAEQEAARVDLSIRQGTRLELGSDIDIAVDSERGGYLTVLDYDAAGNLVQIFPNDPSLRGGVPSRIRAEEAVTLPGDGAGFRFRAAEPLGRGLLVAIVSDADTGLGDLTVRHKDLSVVARPKAYAVELAEALRELGSRASVATLEYEIIGPGTDL